MEHIEPIYTTGFRPRDEAFGPVTCAACGCRLQPAADSRGFTHYGAMGGHDARGHRVDCVDRLHDTSGLADLASVA